MKLILAEIKYYKPVFIAMSLPLIIFTLSGLADVKVLTKLDFVDKYFWSITIGMGTYMLIYGMQVARLKEQRDRMHAVLPVQQNYFSMARYVFGLLPVVVTAVYLVLLGYLLPSDWFVYVIRVVAQLGLLFIALGALSILYEIVKFGSALKTVYTSLLVSIGFVVISVLSAGLIYGVSTSIIKPLPFGGDELYFYLWALILTYISYLIFMRRKSYAV